MEVRRIYTPKNEETIPLVLISSARALSRENQFSRLVPYPGLATPAARAQGKGVGKKGRYFYFFT
jgi:hypothetical protein